MSDPFDPVSVWTDQGRTLWGKAQTGKVLKFSRIVIGSGDWSAAAPPVPWQQVTGCAEPRISSPIVEDIAGDGVVELKYQFSNAELDEGFTRRELAVMALDPDTGAEVCYAHVHYPAGGTTYIPAAGGSTLYEARPSVLVVTDSVDQDVIEVNLNSSLIYVTRDEVTDPLRFEAVQRESNARRDDAGRDGFDADYLDGAHLLEIVRPGDVKIVLDDTPPDGWLELDGAEYLIADYQALYDRAGAWLLPGADGDHFRLLDMRGETLRGWDNGRGIDAGRVLGSAQADAIGLLNATNGATTNSVLVSTARRAQQPATDSLDGLASGSFFGDADASSVSRANGGGRFATETRMRNVAFMFCIRY